MPRIKRWFPVSRDIFTDPQTTELIETFGHEGFTMWMACLKMAEDDEGAILARSYTNLAGSIAALSRVSVEKAEKAVRLWVKWRWLSQEWYESAYGSGGLVFRTYNYSKYHPNQSMRPVQSFSTPPRAQRRSNFTEGEQRKNQAGYVQVFSGGKWRLLHQIIAEAALGKPLPPGAVVHHVNLLKEVNVNQNLVICHDLSYHNTLHRRTFERFEIDPSGCFIKKSRGSYFSQAGKTNFISPPPPSEPSDPNLPILRVQNPPSAAASLQSLPLKEKPKTLDSRIKTWADQIYQTDTKKYNRLITWIKAAERTYPTVVIATSLEKFLPFAREVADWWPYLDKILDKEEARYNGSHTQQESDRIKRQERIWLKG